MKGVIMLFRQKNIWIGLPAILGVIAVLSFALLGSTVNPAPKNMPVALVVEDEGAALPDGSQIDFGKRFEEKLLNPSTDGGPASPLKWTKVGSIQEAKNDLDRQMYYAAVVLPKGMTKQILSLQSPNPQPPQAEVFLNQGKNATGAAAISQVLDKMFAGMNGQLRTQILDGIKKRGDSLSTAQAGALAEPLHVETTTVNAVVPNTAGGSAPVTLTQLTWMGALIGTLMQFFSARKTGLGKRSYSLLLGQMASGLLFGIAAVGSILLLTAGIIGLDIPDVWGTVLFLYFVYYCFFLLQSALFQYIGMGAMPILILLFFFGLPVLSMPYEFLPSVTQDWFFSWVPLRFSVEGFRDLFYFGQGLDLNHPVRVLEWIGAGAVLLLLASPLAARQTVKEPALQTNPVAKN